MPDGKRLINEGPTVVGLMTSVIGSGGSLDAAVRMVASDGPPESSRIFSEAVRRTDTKEERSVKDALTTSMGDLPAGTAGYRQAILLCISASEAGDRGESSAVFSEASEVALDAVRLMGERYSASLTAPCMAVYSLCILAPLVIMTIIPVMGIGGLFGSMAIDEGVLTLIMLVLIPAVMVGICMWLRSANPFLERGHGTDLRVLLPALSVVPIFIMIAALGRSVEESLTISAITAALSTMILSFADRRKEQARRRAEDGLRDCVFEMGTAMMSGGIFENASVDAMGSRPECAEAASALGREMDICRGDVESAVEKALSPISEEVSRVLCDVRRCSMTDGEEAGRLASSVGRQFQNRADVMTGLELKLKSMTDMMTGTAMIFAPMVLGLSIALLGPLSEISGFHGMEGTGLITTAYLIELCAMVSLMSASLGTDSSLGGIVWRYSMMLPVSLVVFGLCSSISLRRVFRNRPRLRMHGIQEEGPSIGSSSLHLPRRRGPPLPLSRSVRDVHRRRRFPGDDGRMVEGARRGIDPVCDRRYPMPSGALQDIHAQRLPPAGVHEGYGYDLRSGDRIHGVRPIGTLIVSEAVRHRRGRPRSCDARGMVDRDHWIRFPRPAHRIRCMRRNRGIPISDMDALQGAR